MKDEGGTTVKEHKTRDITERTLRYSVRAITLFQNLQEGKATSIGANVGEAQHGESRADFIHKYSIAQKEANESLYWLRLLAASGIVSQVRLEPLLKETTEIKAIITAIILNSKRNSRLRARDQSS